MKFLNINYSKKPKYYIFLFGAFILINSIKVLASEDKLHIGKNNETYDFEQVYFQKVSIRVELQVLFIAEKMKQL